MSSEPLNYPKMLQAALRGLVREALAEVEEEGMPGDHHFFIQFSTRYPGLAIPAFLRDQYPDEMTIILQHQFWDLLVEEDSFSVTLSFNANRHRMTIPFEAVTSFADPSVRFALGIEAMAPLEAEAEAGSDADEGDKPTRAGSGAQVVKLDSFRKPRS